ncbi:MAG TPA: ubiquitin-like domain-containing protein [Actinomycetes bacterium]|nr:ubiquitin-like domain-containing protein [Actinomycetes bacterium]
MQRAPLQLALYGAALAALVGGATAFVSFDKALVLSVDGQERKVHTFAKTVGDVLEDHNVEVGSHDTVAPGLGAKVSDGTHIAVRYGRMITVTVDGKERSLWVTANSVQEALQQIGVRNGTAFVSVSRSMPIGRQGLSFDVRLPHTVTLDVEGKSRKLETTAPTVAAAIVGAGVPLTEKDLVLPDRATYPKDGELIKVFKITGKAKIKTEAVSYRTKRIADFSMYKGSTKVIRDGTNGARRVAYEFVKRDGKWVIKRTLFTESLRKSVRQVIRVGAKARPAPAPAPAPARQSAPAPSGSSGGLNWGALAQCESGGNPNAVSPNGLYFGLYQFSVSTWHSVGGSGNPTDASSAEQTRRAQILYDRAGSSPWPVCGSRLYS